MVRRIPLVGNMRSGYWLAHDSVDALSTLEAHGKMSFQHWSLGFVLTLTAILQRKQAKHVNTHLLYAYDAQTLILVDLMFVETITSLIVTFHYG